MNKEKGRKYNKIFDKFIKEIEDNIPCEKCKKKDLISFPNDERNPYLIEFYCLNEPNNTFINEYKWIRRLNPKIEKEHYELVEIYNKNKIQEKGREMK